MGMVLVGSFLQIMGISFILYRSLTVTVMYRYITKHVNMSDNVSVTFQAQRASSAVPECLLVCCVCAFITLTSSLFLSGLCVCVWSCVCF